jgi:hypothetical protein
MRGILTEDNGELMVRGGSLAIGDNRADCARRLIEAWTGEIKAAPLLGGNVKRMISGTPDPFWAGSMKAQLNAEGITVTELKVTEQGIELRIEN